MALRVLLAGLARRAGSAAQQQLLPALVAAPLAGAPVAAGSTWAPLPLLRATAVAEFSTSHSPLSDSLASLLKREIKHEQTTYEQPEAVAKGPPAPFTLSSAPGDGTVSLKRDFGGEQVSVDASINMQSEPAELEEDEGEGEGEDEEYSTEVTFNVTVTKGGSSLVFECASDGSYLEVAHVSHEPAEGLESETAYTGPVYPELALPVREGFVEYLRERGVDEDLGEWLRHALYDKEQREYIAWLERVAAFVDK